MCLGFCGEYWRLIHINDRHQRVILKVYSAKLLQIKAGLPQSLILASLLFIFYINDFLEGLEKKAKLFAEDNSFFFIYHDSIASSVSLNTGPSKWISKWKGHGTLKNIASHHGWPTRKIFEF